MKSWSYAHIDVRIVDSALETHAGNGGEGIGDIHRFDFTVSISIPTSNISDVPVSPFPF